MAIEKEVRVKFDMYFDKGSASAAKTMAATAKREIDSVTKAEFKAAADSERQAARVFANKAKLLARWEKEQAAAVKRAAALEAKAAKEAERAEERRIQAVERAAAMHSAANARMIRGSLTLARGIGDVGKAFAYSGLIGEESMRKVLDVLLTVETVTSGLRGAAGIFTGARNFATAFTAQQTASSVLSAGGSAAGSAAAGAVGGAAGGTAATVGTSGVVGFGIAAAKVGAVALAGAEALQFVRRSFGDTSKSSESLVGALWSMRNAQVAAQKSAEQRAKWDEAFEQKKAAAAKRDEVIRGRAELLAGFRSDTESIASRMAAASGMTEQEQVNRSRLTARAEVDQAAAAVEQERQRAADRAGRAEMVSFDDQLQAIGRLKTARESVAAAEERNLQIQRQQVAERQRAVVAAEQEVAAAKARERTAAAGVEGKLATLGKLDPVQTERAARISREGVQSADDAAFLERIGVGTGKAQGFFANKGREAGGEDILSGLGELDSFRSAQAETAAAQKAFADQTAALIQAKKEEVTAQGETQKALNELTGVLRQLLGANSDAKGLSGKTFDAEKLGDKILEPIEGLYGSLDALSAKVKRQRERFAANQL